MLTRIAAGLFIALALVVAALPAARWVLWRRELNPILRGTLLAGEQGCLACHWPWAGREIPNPESRWGSVPRFAAGNARMYAETREELEEFIRFGAPLAWLDSAKGVERLENQHLRMPAYGTTLSDTQIEDLVSFVGAIELVELPGDDQAATGRTVAWKHGCPACHGVEASGGLANPGSLGGFIPGFAGGNFTDLVRDESEFREWVLDGTSRRLQGNPLARFFWSRQKISMPAYRGLLSDQELDQLWRWTLAVRQSSRSAPRSP